MTFTPEMALAIREGRKNQTRRPIKQLRRFGKISEFGPSDTKGYDWHFRDPEMRWHDLTQEKLLKYSPWQVGDRLWVKEEWAYWGGDEYIYQADIEAVMYRSSWDSDLRRPIWCIDGEPVGDRKGWRPSIHMPKWAARTWLEITEVRVQRVQEISEGDIIAEGCPSEYLLGINWFRPFWNSLYGPDAWDRNDWAWALTFKVLEEKERAA
ncbi:MAG TPA: hypothetical protein DF383_11255 [Deltaproteobacteria bacterium]|nr:hypothetical protein [Deltaproteobacteria bacterium]